MRLRRAPARPRPRRTLARRGAVLAAAAVLAALAGTAIAAAVPRAAPAASPAQAAMSVTAATVTRAGPAAPGSGVPAPAVLTAASSSCGFFDVTCQIASSITGWFAGLIASAVNPLVNFIGSSALSTPQPSSIPAVSSLQESSLAIADACYGLLVLIGGIIVMSHETLQASYSAKEIAPRIVTGFIAANLSTILISRAIGISNGVSAALAEGGHVSQQDAARQLLTTLANSAQADHGAFLLLLELAGVVLALVLAAVYVIRMMAVVLLAVATPLLISLWALPHTGWAARWCCRAWVAVLAIPAAQGLVLSAAVRVFFSPGWLPGSGGYLEQVLITLCLLYILMRIPFWIGRPVLSPFGPSPARRAVRFAFAAVVLSRVRPALTGATGRGGPARPAGRATGGVLAGTGGGGPPGRRPGAAGTRTAGGTPPGTGSSSAATTRWTQPPLPGMPSPPRRSQHQQLALFDPPPSWRQPPAPSPVPPPRAAAGRGGQRGYRQPPLPGMPVRPAPPRRLALPLDPPPRRVPRTRISPEGSS
jgi:hypothetical protein